jgi:DNA repair protein RadC
MAPTTQIREATVRYRGRGRKAPARVNGPGDAAEVLRAVIDSDPREHFVALHLDARNAPIGYEVISIGTANASLVHPREVFRSAIISGAVGVIVAHNHPSGDPSPSREDLQVTERLVEAGKLLGVGVLDSLVITDDSYHSLRDAGSVRFN